MTPVKTPLDAGKTWVVKVGSSLLTRQGAGLAVELVAQWVDDIVALHQKGIRVVLVSSGAVAEGMVRLGLDKRPESVNLLQAAAAVGQMGLIQLYESNFQRHRMHTAQILLTHDDLRARERYLNARATLKRLLDLNVVPVVNENDTVVTDEIRFGDNDTLAGMVANLIEADTLVLLTDQQGLYDRDPRLGGATLLSSAAASDEKLDEMAGAGGVMGRGGMVTKVQAARIAARSGANTVIASGQSANILRDLDRGELHGTLLKADTAPLVSRKQWLAALPVRGKVYLDSGAVLVLKNQGKSLLPVGVKKVDGEFTRGDMVACVNADGHEVARGFINYNHHETCNIMGRATRDIESILGFVNEEELIHRDNLVLSQ
jgi:glutamate 5-kinase